MSALRPSVIYSPDYDIHFFGLEKLHPFDSRKHSRAWNEVRRSYPGTLADLTLQPPRPASRDELLAVHDGHYLDQLASPEYVSRALEVPLPPLPHALGSRLIRERVLTPMSLASMGTVMAAERALGGSMAINLSGGYHHASRDRGGGFCLYADIPLAVALLRQTGRLAPEDTVLIVDLDAHQGNGVERMFRDDPAVCVFDMYNRDIYPQDFAARERIDREVPLRSGTADSAYLDLLRQELTGFVQAAPHPRLAFYNAGTDIFEGDLLGKLSVSAEGVFARDRFVFDLLTEAGIPWAMVLSGGYSKESYLLIARSLLYVLGRWGAD